MKTNYTKRINVINNIFQGIKKNFDFSVMQNSWSKENKNEWASDLDIKIDNYIQSQIKKNYPRENIFSEETSSKLDTKLTWIIDPIDGTHNFLGGSASFGVIIVFIKTNEVRSCGILLPKFNEIWIAQKGKGVWLNGKKFIKPKSESKPFVFGHSSLRYESLQYLNILHNLSRKGFSVRLDGSASFDTTLLAKSKGLMFQENPKLYDIAATACMFRELGATVMDRNMDKWDIDSKGILVVYNFKKQEQKDVLKLLKTLLLS